MKKLFGLMLLAMGFCFVGRTQQGQDQGDSMMGGQEKLPNGVHNPFQKFAAAARESNKVWLQWEVDSAMEGNYFIIERSADGSRFETIGALRSTRLNDHYELMDLAPPNGFNFYRIRYTEEGKEALYSKTLQLSLSGNVDFKFYPNPVDKLFIVHTEHTIEFQVIDAAGSVRLSKRLQPGIQVVDVSFLERGVYILRVADKESNRTISRQLIKN